MTDTPPTNTECTIICEGDWAKNYPRFDPGPFPSFKKITFDNKPPGDIDWWYITHYEQEGAYKIQSTTHGGYARASGDTVDATEPFDPKTCTWFIEPAGDGKFKILVPDRNRVWTVEESGDEKMAFLRPAVGFPNQLFTFELK